MILSEMFALSCPTKTKSALARVYVCRRVYLQSQGALLMFLKQFLPWQQLHHRRNHRVSCYICFSPLFFLPVYVLSIPLFSQFFFLLSNVLHLWILTFINSSYNEENKICIVQILNICLWTVRLSVFVDYFNTLCIKI